MKSAWTSTSQKIVFSETTATSVRSGARRFSERLPCQFAQLFEPSAVRDWIRRVRRAAAEKAARQVCSAGKEACLSSLDRSLGILRNSFEPPAVTHYRNQQPFGQWIHLVLEADDIAGVRFPAISEAENLLATRVGLLVLAELRRAPNAVIEFDFDQLVDDSNVWRVSRG